MTTQPNFLIGASTDRGDERLALLADDRAMVTISVRDAGQLADVITLRARRLSDGSLQLVVEARDVYRCEDVATAHPPTHRSAIEVRTHSQHAVRHGTQAAPLGRRSSHAWRCPTQDRGDDEA